MGLHQWFLSRLEEYNSPHARSRYSFLWFTSMPSGRSDEAVEYFLRALRLNPRPNSPRIEVFVTMLARAQLAAGKFEAALASARRATGGIPNFFEALLIQASALAHLGRQSDASAALIQAQELRPTDFVLPANWARYKDPPACRYIIDGLRTAGWRG